MQHKVTFAYIVTVSKVYDGDEEVASQAAYAETQKKELDIAVTVPEGFTVESITDEDTVWDVEEVHPPERSILRP